ncbi:sigma-E processing peptidase SpoIIGA [Gracilibacillus boraciitolerans]|uniref:sigma-E processing peptidase SpoIIGA n=1 Tax=Gracilibacillus boraciitolerans TaxID=307521 RepID=UPI001F3FBE96|nr:sigma-E processing peptidase SpoIIGA [Gracilibacillus boraciitolerans]
MFSSDAMERKERVVIYVEVIWLLNFMIDWMILLLTQSVTKHISSWYRLLLASFVGSLIVPISFIFPTFPIDTWFLKITHSFVIIWIAFGFHNVAIYLKVLFTFYFMTFSIGGGLFAIHFLFSSEQYLQSFNTIKADHIHGIFVIIFFPIIFFFTKYRMDKHKMQQFYQEFYYKVTIFWKNKKIETTGYLDSGNHLVDPFTQTPVIIVDEVILQDWLNEAELAELQQSFRKLMEGEDQSINSLFRLIPYQGVNGHHDFMIAFKPDYVQIDLRDTHVTNKKVLVGIQFGNLVADNSYHCLLHPKLFQQTG